MFILLECDTMANSIICYSSKVPGGLETWYPVIAESDEFVPPIPFISASRQIPGPTGLGREIKPEMETQSHL